MISKKNEINEKQGQSIEFAPVFGTEKLDNLLFLRIIKMQMICKYNLIANTNKLQKVK